jgi:hypothetical protein
MERQAEIGVCDEREEAERAVAGPLQQEAVRSLADLSLDVGASLAEDADGEPALLQELPIRVPGRLQRGVGVVEEIDVARAPRRPDAPLGDGRPLAGTP